MRNLVFVILLAATSGIAAEREVDPTFLFRRVPDLSARPSDVTTSSCRYVPIFGAGDPQARILRGVARYGEIRVDAGGKCEEAAYPAEEQIYVVLEGAGAVTYDGESSPVRKNDFMYFPPAVRHALHNPSSAPVRALVMGFRVPAGVKTTRPAKLPIAGIGEVKKETVAGHPPTTLYQLLMGTTDSRRDRLATAAVMTSLFIMEFAPGGTNFPHHHESEEEIYYVLDGRGEMVAGGGVDGVENRRPARAGDAYFFRLNCTVGFYNSPSAGEPPARILAVRSKFPGR
jgi:mannose-6-phosphate isomerase-like protein (cupin superfamily)